MNVCKNTVSLVFILFLSFRSYSNDAKLIHEWNHLLIELMVKDGFSPVLATRGFVYPNIAAYHAQSLFDKNLKSLNGKLNEFDASELEIDTDSLISQIVMVEAVWRISKLIMYREQDCNELYQKQISQLSIHHDDFIIRLSKSAGQKVADYIIKWMNKDGYNETKAKPNYIFVKGTFNWQPTPPEFRNALEPNWMTLRPFVLNNISEFSEPLSVIPDSSKESDFYKLALEVYNLNSKFTGHIGIPRRHINPASHWINIVRQVCIEKNKSLTESIRIYTLLSIAEADAKIVAWYDKYTFNLIRPVTYIRRYIDADWMPLLVTPAFPEHTSAHSACSMACAEVLTAILGENVSFTDSTMVKYLGLPARNFPSFKSAALEVTESRLFGGIHYRTAVEAGMKQGKKISHLVISKLFDEK
jgi:hypothetical protein